MEPREALKHWARWVVDYGSWRTTCYSIEGRYANDPERYRWAVDEENAAKRLSFRYDPQVGQRVERLVSALPQLERDAMRARYVYWPHLADDQVARRLAMSARAFDTVLLSATMRFARAWRESTREAA